MTRTQHRAAESTAASPATPGEVAGARSAKGARGSRTTDDDRHAGDPDFMASFARGLTVIRAFTGGTGRRTIGAVAQSTGLSRAAVRRCLYTLQQLGYAHLDERRGYRLRPKILSLGYAYLSSSPLPLAAKPVLDHASATLHESCSVAVLDGDEVVYVARSAATRRLMSIDLGVGSRLPAYCTSMGRVLLASLSPDELESRLRSAALVAYTDRTVTGVDALRARVTEVARDGHSVVDQELEIGLRSLAVPVRDLAGNVVAALNVSTHATRVSREDLIGRCLPVLEEAARDLAQQLPG